MSTADDLRDLRDVLDSIAHGALPRWGIPTTKTGEEAVRAAKAVYDRFVCALLAESGGRAAMAKVKEHEDSHRTHAEILTDYNEKLERECDDARAEVDRLRAERRQLRARLVECRPWVGVCPLEPAKINEMCAIRDLADDTLEEVKPWQP